MQDSQNFLFTNWVTIIHQVHKPKYEGKEDVADKWSKKLTTTFLANRYWYLFPIAPPIALINGLAKDVAKLYRRFRH